MQTYNRQARSSLTVEYKHHQVKLGVAKSGQRQGARWRQLRFNNSGNTGAAPEMIAWAGNKKAGIIIVMADSFYLK